MKIKIVEAGNSLGLGGTELVIENFCRHLDKTRFEITVVGFQAGGVRGEILQNLGFPVVIAKRDPEVWSKVLAGCDVLHWHGDGTLSPAVFEPVRRHKPPLVIQTNVFGFQDHSDYYDLIDFDLYISRMILHRRLLLDEKEARRDFSKRLILYNPVDVSRIRENLPTAAELERCRQQLGLGKALTIGQVGRPDDRRFHPVTLRMLASLRRWLPGCKFLLVGATPYIQNLAVQLGVADCSVWVEPTADLKTLLTYYGAVDVYLGACMMGESFGMNITEAMACGLPIVVVSTPHDGNGQIELIDHGVNGLVVEGYPRLVALACRELLTNAPLRRKLGQAAQVKVQSYAAEKMTRALENIIYQGLGLTGEHSGQNIEAPFPLRWSTAMALDYQRRLGQVFAWPRLDDRFKAWVHRRVDEMRFRDFYA